MHPRSLVSALALAFAAGPALADGDPLAASLQKVVEQQVATFNAENLSGSMATIHSQSPEYQPTQEELAEQFPEESLSAALVSFQYVGHDDEFAVARVKLKVSAPEGDEFVDNVSDTMMLFHQENGAWRVWGDFLIGVQTLE
jgi:hypothetical protein